jgi:hypothetical protein
MTRKIWAKMVIRHAGGRILTARVVSLAKSKRSTTTVKAIYSTASNGDIVVTSDGSTCVVMYTTTVTRTFGEN